MNKQKYSFNNFYVLYWFKDWWEWNLLMNMFDAGQELNSNHQNGFESEFSSHGREKLLQIGSQEVHDQSVVFSTTSAKMVHFGNTQSAIGEGLK